LSSRGDRLLLADCDLAGYEIKGRIAAVRQPLEMREEFKHQPAQIWP
jgi:hypothetical protein